MATQVTVVAGAVIIILCRVMLTSGEVRCYCNEQACEATSYMCHSQTGCFANFAYMGSASQRSPHGCVESLTEDDRTICQNVGDILMTRNGPDTEWPILMCCKGNLCNPMGATTTSGDRAEGGRAQAPAGAPDINISVDTRSNISTFYQGGSHQRPPYDHSLENEPPDLMQRDLWFKAAVIAVPIAGGFILILLVLLAVRMLRNDSRRHRQLMQMRRHRSLTKAQLYVTDHFYPANKCLQYYSTQPCGTTDPHVPVCTDVNIKLDYGTGQAYEKISESSAQDGSCNSIVVWGKPGCKPAANMAMV